MTRPTLALALWNLANQRAMRDYRARPTRACPRSGCDQLANGRVCINHERQNAVDSVRGRAKRSAA